MRTRVAVVVGLAFLLLGGALAVLGGSVGSGAGVARAMPLAQATIVPTPTPAVRYVSSVSGNDTGDCTQSDAPCKSIQYAVDRAVEKDLVWIAASDNAEPAVYTAAGDNVIELTKTLELRGGYVYAHTSTGATWTAGLLPSVVDGERARRPLYVKGVTPTLRLLSFVRGKAERGGNVYAEDSSLHFVGTPILSGTATYGGGMYLKNCQASFDAGGLGGGSALLSGLLLVRNNVADYGGGLYVDGGSPVLAALAVYSNTATVAGGGVYFDGGQPTFAGGVVLQNHAASGGGFYLRESRARIAAVGVYSNTASNGAGFYVNGPLSVDSMPMVVNNYVRYNRADGEGGGFYFEQARAGLVNNIVADNQADDGAAMYLMGSSPLVYHNTLAVNAGDTGVYVTHMPGSVQPPVAPVPSSPYLVNDMIVSHTVGVYVASTGFSIPENQITMLGTLWWGNDDDIDGPGKVFSSTWISGDPRFRCTGSLPDCVLPYHILTDSVAVDAGMNIGSSAFDTDVMVDIDGQLRPSGGGFDIGADEVVSRSHSVWLFPSLTLVYATPGETVTQTHWLLNSGTETDTYDLSVGDRYGWALLTSEAVVTLTAGASETVYVRVTVPNTAATGTVDSAVVTATSRSDPNVRAYAIDGVMVISGSLNLEVSKGAEVELVDPGEAVTYTIVVTKSGVVTGTLAVTLTDTAVPTSAIGGWQLPAGCTGDLATGAFTCTWDVSGAAEPITKSWTVVITTTDAYTGLLINTATVSGSGSDMDLQDNASLVAVGVQVEKGYVYLPVVLKGYTP